MENVFFSPAIVTCYAPAREEVESFIMCRHFVQSVHLAAHAF